ncbi:MAG: caspase family protein [Xanthobacteraceae bacterium]
MPSFTKGRAGLVAFVVATLVLCEAAHAAKKIALVIGNSSYRNVTTLSNPTNDASDVAGSFERLGFEVMRVRDATYDRMRRALLDFGRAARGAEVAVVYYAGHGIEVSGENWLVPVDAELRSDVDIDHEAIGLKGVMVTVENASRLGLVILDACRNNPFAAKMRLTVRTRSVARGLAQVEPSGNVLVAYAARGGTLAADGDSRNSPFTTALLRHIETPGLEINFLFRNVRDDVIKATKGEQQPFVYGSLSSEAVYLMPAALGPGAGKPPASSTPAYELAYWDSIKNTTNVHELEAYLKAYPNGAFVALAKLRIAELRRQAAPEPPVTRPPSKPAAKRGKCFTFQGRDFCE